ncbi:hypothetical protein [Shewanella sp. cp20]|nr:hypothetical protein [Shewanella sp. cp20]
MAVSCSAIGIKQASKVTPGVVKDTFPMGGDIQPAFMPTDL